MCWSFGSRLLIAVSARAKEDVKEDVSERGPSVEILLRLVFREKQPQEVTTPIATSSLLLRITSTSVPPGIWATTPESPPAVRTKPTFC